MILQFTSWFILEKYKQKRSFQAPGKLKEILLNLLRLKERGSHFCVICCMWTITNLQVIWMVLTKYVLYYPRKTTYFLLLYTIKQDLNIFLTLQVLKAKWRVGRKGKRRRQSSGICTRSYRNSPWGIKWCWVCLPIRWCTLLHVSWGLPVPSGLVPKWSEAMVEAVQIVLDWACL